MEEQSIVGNPPNDGGQEENQQEIGKEDKKIVHLANAPEKFGELINNEIIQFFVERKTEKAVEINQLISGIRDKVFNEEKIKKIMLRNALENKELLEDYFYPLYITGIFTLIKDKKLEIAGDVKKFLETYVAIKNNTPKKIEKGVVFLKINKYFLQDMLGGKDKKVEKGKKKEDTEEDKELTQDEFTEEEAEKIIIEILRENEKPMTKKELFLELHILSKNKLSQIFYKMKQKGLIDYQPGDWQKSLITLISEEIIQPKEDGLEREKETQIEELSEEELLTKDIKEKEILEEKPKEEQILKSKLDDPVQKAFLDVFKSNWGEESLNLNKLFIILKTWDHDEHISLKRFSGPSDPEFIKLISSIPGVKIDEEGKIIYNQQKE